MHAVNLCDWVGHKDDFCLKMLLAPVINEDAPTVECERGSVSQVGEKGTDHEKYLPLAQARRSGKSV